MRNFLLFFTFIVVCLSMEIAVEYPNVHKINDLQKQLETKDKIYRCKTKSDKRDKQMLVNELKSEKYENKIIREQLDQVNLENEKLKKDLASREEVKQRQLHMELTYYTSNCLGCSGITKTGINVKNSVYFQGYRIIATDPRVIPLHSIVKIESPNESFLAYASDTGGAIKGNLIDVLVSSEKEAIKKGRQKATVTIIKEGSDN